MTNSQLPDHLNDPELLELLKTSQVHAQSRRYWKYNKTECRFFYRRYFTEDTVIAKPLDSKFSNDENQEILTCRNTLAKRVKRYINNNLNPASVNRIDPTKGIFTQPLSVREILDELEISKDDYYRTLSIK